MHLTRPRFEWTWNVNTVAVLAGFAAGFVAWGYTLAELRVGREQNAQAVTRLEQRVTAVELASRQLDNHELRIGTVERQASEGATAMRAVEQALSNLASDIRVTREIVQRMESRSSRQNGR